MACETGLKKYDIVIHEDLAEFIEIMNKAMEKGYEPIGSLFNFDGNFIQPIILCK